MWYNIEYMELREKKDNVINLLRLHPSTGWYRQSLEVYCTAEEIAELELDTQFLKDVQATLFLHKQELMRKRYEAIEISGAKGGWQGYDKLLQEVDSKLFNIKQDISLSTPDARVEVYIPDNGRDNDKEN